MIRIKALDKTFRSAKRTVHVIDHIDLEIPKGSFFTLVGPSGSGKTTILRVIAGLERHDSGQLWIGDKLMSDPANRVFVPASERGLGMVFQSYAIWPHMNVFENVAYPLKRSRKRPPAAEIRTRVLETLELVGLQDLAEVPAHALSGGQQQRVALARALVARPSVLLLDEPLSNLDAQLRERMRSEVRDIQRRIGITALYVTHDRAEALSMSTLVAVMNLGKIEMIGTPREVYDAPTTKFTAEFLGQCSIIPGVVQSVQGDGRILVNTKLGELKSRAPAQCAAGQRVDVVVRPEDIVVSRVRADSAELTGTLSNLNYLGDRLECSVVANGETVRVTTHPAEPLAMGDPVQVRISERCWAISG